VGSRTTAALARLLPHAQRLHRRYIADGADMQVNISYGARARIGAVLRRGMDGFTQAGGDVFAEAEREIFHVLVSGAVPRFLHSPLLAEWRGDVQAEAAAAATAALAPAGAGGHAS
jgi:hypothetical protein